MARLSHRTEARLKEDRRRPLGSLTSANELLLASLAQPVPLLEPLLNGKSLALLHGPRGQGKTFVAMGIAWAVAGGGRFLDWTAPSPKRVLYVDGEMAAVDMQQRLRLFGAVPSTLDFLLADLQPDFLPDLGFQTGQTWLMNTFNKTGRRPDLLVLDNLASLTGFNSNDPDRWTDLQHFLLAMRRIGIAVLAIHHTNRRGLQRGTSRREDVLDLILALRRPADYAPQQGARFELHFEKTRGLHGSAIEPIEARLETDVMGAPRWHWQPAHLSELKRVVTLLRQGLAPPQIARELGISRAWSYRLKEQAVQKGLIDP